MQSRGFGLSPLLKDCLMRFCRILPKIINTKFEFIIFDTSEVLLQMLLYVHRDWTDYQSTETGRTDVCLDFHIAAGLNAAAEAFFFR